jgi:hypothetical protein
LDFKDVRVLDALNPFEADASIKELVRAGLPTYNVNQKVCETCTRKISYECFVDYTGEGDTFNLVFSICIRTH